MAKIVIGFPPNYEEIKKVFGPAEEGQLYCVGTTIFNPTNHEIPPDLLFHEEIHVQQQKDWQAWWKNYLADPSFRLNAELEAYAGQYQFVTQKVKDKELLGKFFHKICLILSGKMYGRMLSYGEAEVKLKQLIK